MICSFIGYCLIIGLNCDRILTILNCSLSNLTIPTAYNYIRTILMRFVNLQVGHIYFMLYPSNEETFR